MNPISGPLHPTPAPPPPPAPPAPEGSGADRTTFRNILLEGIEQVNSMQHDADVAVQQLMTGEDIDPAVVLTTIQKADISFRMMTQIRNKLLQAYQEIKEMRI